MYKKNKIRRESYEESKKIHKFLLEEYKKHIPKIVFVDNMPIGKRIKFLIENFRDI